MRVLGNILWIILGGFLSALGWCIAGCIWCVTVVGIPIGMQCFKLAKLSFFPFGKTVEYGGGPISLTANIFWLIFSGIPLAVGFAAWGALLCLTFIGIPFGVQMFKLAKLALMPFGATVK